MDLSTWRGGRRSLRKFCTTRSGWRLLEILAPAMLPVSGHHFGVSLVADAAQGKVNGSSGQQDERTKEQTKEKAPANGRKFAGCARLFARATRPTTQARRRRRRRRGRMANGKSCLLPAAGHRRQTASERERCEAGFLSGESSRALERAPLLGNCMNERAPLASG